MPYGKRNDGHVTRVPYYRLDSTGEISSDRLPVQVMDVNKETKSYKQSDKFNFRNMFNNKCLKSDIGNNLTSDSNSSFRIISDLMNLKPQVAKSVITDQKDSHWIDLMKGKSVPSSSWNHSLTSTFHPAIMASALMNGSQDISFNSCPNSQHSYIPKMTYCNFNRCYQNKFRQKYLKGMSGACNSNRQRKSGPSKPHSAVSKSFEDDKCQKAVIPDMPDVAAKPEPQLCDEVERTTCSTLSTDEKLTCPSEVTSDLIDNPAQPTDILPKSCDNENKSCDEKLSLNLSEDEVVNNWLDLCSDEEDNEEHVVPECWDEMDKHESNNQKNEKCAFEKDTRQFCNVKDLTTEQLTVEPGDNYIQNESSQKTCEGKSDPTKFCDLTKEKSPDTCDTAQIKISFSPMKQSQDDDDIERDPNERKDDDKSFILYIRKDNKKSKQSAKRRRRSKAKKVEENFDEKPRVHGKHEAANKAQNSALAFMLGITSDNDSATSRPFFMTVSDADVFSDWSEDEDQSDEGIQSDPEWPDELDMPLNLSVFCSLKEPEQTECSKQLKDINMAWKIQISRKPSSSSLDEKRNKQDRKKVHFADEDTLTEVHQMTSWADEYEEARKGPWYQYALDHERFQKRIGETEKILAPVLAADHRNKILTKLTESSD